MPLTGEWVAVLVEKAVRVHVLQRAYVMKCMVLTTAGTRGCQCGDSGGDGGKELLSTT